MWSVWPVYLTHAGLGTVHFSRTALLSHCLSQEFYPRASCGNRERNDYLRPVTDYRARNWYGQRHRVLLIPYTPDWFERASTTLNVQWASSSFLLSSSPRSRGSRRYCIGPGLRSTRHVESRTLQRSCKVRDSTRRALVTHCARSNSLVGSLRNHFFLFFFAFFYNESRNALIVGGSVPGRANVYIITVWVDIFHAISIYSSCPHL